MKAIEIKKGVYWVGVVDWNIRNFHGHTYTTARGSTYNAYLVVGEKVALVDTVLGSFAGEMIERIRQIVPPEKIDYIIANHVEPDHSGALSAISKLAPNALVLGTAKCKEGLHRYYYGDWKFKEVKSGDTLALGLGKTLSFIEAPMIHWPDSMFTYLAEESLLMPNDAFGQHYATSERFDDEVDPCALMDEAEKYYANILWPLGTIIQRKLEEVLKLNLPISMIAPSHGIIWRKDPMKIVNAYRQWVKNESSRSVVIVYETMWGATEKMARAIGEGVAEAGASVKLFNVNDADKTEIVREMFRAKGYLIGSSTHDNDMLPTMAGFLELLKGLKPKQRSVAAFGSYGWSGGAVAQVEEVLTKMGLVPGAPSLSVKYMPDGDDLKKCRDFGREFAGKL